MREGGWREQELGKTPEAGGLGRNRELEASEKPDTHMKSEQGREWKPLGPLRDSYQWMSVVVIVPATYKEV